MAMSLNAADIAACLGGGQRAGNGWKARCPSHNDKHASLVIYDRPNGGVNVKCMADCEQGTVVAKLQAMRLWPEHGMRKDPNLAQAAKHRKAREAIVEVLSRAPSDMAEPVWTSMLRTPPTSIYDYRDVDGGVIGYVVRHDDLAGGKRIMPVSVCRLRDGSLSWGFKAPASFTLYGLELLSQRPDAQILIVEGEKAANAGRRLLPDAITLSWRGGAGAIEKNDFSPLAGRHVTIIPDADEPGRRAGAAAAIQAIAVGAAVVRLIDLPAEFPKGWDIADPLPQSWTLEEVLDKTVEPARAMEAGAPDAQPNENRPLAPYVISAVDLVRMDVPPREYIVEPFITTQSLNMLYAARGIGKTWVGLTLAICVARGDDFFGYTVERERVVLYFDGEMPLPDIQGRIAALAPDPPRGLLVLPSELLYRNDQPLNLHDANDRLRIDQLLTQLEAEGRRPSLIVIDNLSSMSGGVDENDNSALDEFLQWLVSLRHGGAAIILVHHAGKSGAQRGASRREDFLDTSIELKKPSKDRDEEEQETAPHQGAHFILSFPKTRGKRPEPEEIELKLIEYRGQLQWTIGEARTIDASVRMLRAIWESSAESQKDLAAVRGVTPSRISQLCTKLRRRKFIEPSPSLRLTIEGKEALISFFPELEQKMLQQGHLFHRSVL